MNDAIAMMFSILIVMLTHLISPNQRPPAPENGQPSGPLAILQTKDPGMRGIILEK